MLRGAFSPFKPVNNLRHLLCICWGYLLCCTCFISDHFCHRWELFDWSVFDLFFLKIGSLSLRNGNYAIFHHLLKTYHIMTDADKKLCFKTISELHNQAQSFCYMQGRRNVFYFWCNLSFVVLFSDFSNTYGRKNLLNDHWDVR